MKMSCAEQKTKKYRSRDSPPYSAMDCKGAVKTGNDGAPYTSTPDKRGIYRWTKSANGIKNKTIKAPQAKRNVTNATNKACTYKTPNGSINVSQYMRCIPNDVLLGTPKNIYEINDNAAFPFVVFDYGGGNASIYNNRFNEVTNRGELKGKLMDAKYDQLFLGDNGWNDPYWIFKRGVERGNNILLQTGKGKYLFVGKGILSFSCKNGDTIRRFYSPMGGNYDSFPYAVGDKYVYLLNDKNCASFGEFDMTKDVMRQYYCYDMGECKKYKTTALPMKTVYAPFYGYY